mmetsp:Transcript_3355/g.8540  ORF Transcript_3355/g.8540 Transcript_3355/m.8540 type:complete len:203 (-) Transcript_3355:1253-1861(-)
MDILGINLTASPFKMTLTTCCVCCCSPSSFSRTNSNAIVEEYAGHHLHDVCGAIGPEPASSPLCPHPSERMLTPPQSSPDTKKSAPIAYSNANNVTSWQEYRTNGRLRSSSHPKSTAAAACFMSPRISRKGGHATAESSRGERYHSRNLHARWEHTGMANDANVASMSSSSFVPFCIIFCPSSYSSEKSAARGMECALRHTK